jgi:hypothetical protein
MLDAPYASRLAPLMELDLSGLGLGDDGLRRLAESTQLPALRKLILSDNAITEVGVAALAKAKGFPHLDTVYLFHNPVGDRARTLLQKADHFRLANLDLGEHEDGYCLSRGETEVARRRFVREDLLPLVFEYFEKYPRLQSAMLCVAQYWADEADDAVHGQVIVSELAEPIWQGLGYEEDGKPRPDPNVPNTRIEGEYGEPGSMVSGLYRIGWDDNNGAIPLWAAFAPEGGSQEYGNLDEVYAPAMLFYRHGGYEFLPMSRPHLDGVRPEWGWEEDEVEE